jgi:hypothetical protein
MSGLDQRLQTNEQPDLRETLYRLFQKAAGVESGYYLGDSEIAGQGVFATRTYEPGDRIGVAMTAGTEDEFKSKIWNLTELARYCNHQQRANAKTVKNDNQYDLVATRTIEPDDEIVANYLQVTRALGPHSRMQWEGKDIPVTDLQDYFEKAAAKPQWYHSCCGQPMGKCNGCTGQSRLVTQDEL